MITYLHNKYFNLMNKFYIYLLKYNFNNTRHMAVFILVKNFLLVNNLQDRLLEIITVAIKFNNIIHFTRSKNL